ncbi:MAG TPA: glucodextranase DOMON-like domain-containing protein [Gallionella sp.]|nr:glucodextranase DOMON-like domain-containing protein [Gallionella sp.]
MKSSLLFVALMLPMLSARAVQLPLVTISDPSGDDVGAGTLVYPQRSDFQAGDLDLLRLKISRDEKGYWFEAMFKNPIRDPANVPSSDGAESLAHFARKGFYQFNLDVYVDTDRVKGSGNTFTLPGRQVKINPEYAWEKAVILTPRPELMREQLLEAMADQYPDRPKPEIATSVDQSMFFSTRIKVHGKSIAFFVPAGFFAGSDGTDWAVTALVTGAMTTIPADSTLFPTTKTPLERLQLGVMQPAVGRPVNTFGYSGAMPSPVVDMLSPSADQQMWQLAAKDDLTGVSWGPHAVNDIAVAAAPPKPPPAQQKPANPSAATQVVPIGTLLQPENAVADKPVEVRKPAEAKPAEAAPLDPAIVKKLQALQQLYDQKLIDESEYKQQKQRILNDL